MNRLEKFIVSKFTQGTIFSCAVAEQYKNYEVHGIIITARCDISHEKNGIQTYLPIIKFQDWLTSDFIYIFKDRLIKNILDSLCSELKNNGYNESIIKMQTPRNILNALFDKTKDLKVWGKVDKLVTRYESIEKIMIPSSYNTIVKIVKHKDNESVAKKIFEQLVEQKISGYYYLDQIDPSNAIDLGFVIALRDINSIPSAILKRVESGITKDEFIQLCNNNPFFSGKLSFDFNDFSQPISQLKSPDVEHLLQTFTLLFSRIGIEDRVIDYGKKIYEKL